MATAVPAPSSVINSRLAALMAIVAVALAALVAAPAGGIGLGTVGWFLLVAIAARWPVAGVAIVALATPFEQRETLPTVVGDLGVMQYTVWALVAGAMPGAVRRRELVFDRVAVTQIAVVVALVASWAAGGARLASWWQVVEAWLLAALVYLIARSLRPGVGDWRLVVVALTGGVLVHGVTGAWQELTGAGPASYTVGGAVRVYGAFLHPNTLAFYLALIVPMLLALSVERRAGWVAWVARAGTVVGTLTLVLTQSRGGMLALGLAGAALVAVAPRPIQRAAVVAGIALALVAAASGAVDRVPGLERFSTIAVSGGTTQVTPATWGQMEREAHWGAARSMLASHPLFGVGAGEFNDNFREHTPEWRFRVGRGHAHNAYLQLGAEAGVPGLIAFVAWVGTILVVLGRRVVRARGIAFALAAGALATSIAWAAEGIFEYPDVSSIPVVFALIVALGLSGASGDASS